MNDEQLLRYSRHILLDEVGIEGQQRLRDAHVVIVGAGGLGSPATIYLAASGIGRLTLIDDDVVDLTNLQRQILHGTPDLGMTKVDSAAQALQRLNPDVRVHAIAERVDEDRFLQLADRAQVVVDCSDNFATRHLVNRTCVAAAIPLVSGSALRFSGQVASFDLRRSDADDATRAPCYACLFPNTGAADEVACSTMGVFAPLTGIIGATQAAEAIKLVVGLPTLSGRLLLFDALEMTWHSMMLRRDLDCPVCTGR